MKIGVSNRVSKIEPYNYHKIIRGPQISEAESIFTVEGINSDIELLPEFYPIPGKTPLSTPEIIEEDLFSEIIKAISEGRGEILTGFYIGITLSGGYFIISKFGYQFINFLTGAINSQVGIKFDDLFREAQNLRQQAVQDANEDYNNYRGDDPSDILRRIGPELPDALQRTDNTVKKVVKKDNTTKPFFFTETNLVLPGNRMVELEPINEVPREKLIELREEVIEESILPEEVRIALENIEGELEESAKQTRIRERQKKAEQRHLQRNIKLSAAIEENKINEERRIAVAAAIEEHRLQEEAKLQREREQERIALAAALEQNREEERILAIPFEKATKEEKRQKTEITNRRFEQGQKNIEIKEKKDLKKDIQNY
jgi:hypothetical protein